MSLFFGLLVLGGGEWCFGFDDLFIIENLLIDWFWSLFRGGG